MYHAAVSGSGHYVWEENSESFVVLLSMRKSLGFFSLLSISVILVTSCQRGYVIEDGKVYFTGWNEANGNIKYEVEHSDAATFETINVGGNGLWGKDKNHVYHEATIIENADPASFEELGHYYFKTKDSLYYFGSYADLNFCEVKNIGSVKLDFYDTEPWARSGNYVICEHNATYLDDIVEFEPIDSEWGKTKSHIIWIGNVLEGVDVESFVPINRYTGKDKSGTFNAEDRLK